MAPVLEYRTERTLVALPTRDDVERLQRYRLDNREHLAPWEPEREASYYGIDACRTAIESGEKLARAGIGYPMLAFDRRRTRVLASFTLTNVVRGAFQACHLGYGVAADMQGQGLMFEVLQIALRLAFDDLGLHRVMANYMPRNQRSGRLLQRLGFEREGYARAYLRIAGRWEDHVLTARIADMAASQAEHDVDQ